MTQIENVKITDAWLSDSRLQLLFDILEENGGEARINGGAVRNSLMGKPVADVDVATTLQPNDVIARLIKAGHKSIPTGIDHGTVTAVIGGAAYEITTLREDIETDGRHAIVRFGLDWEADANRRDLTINGLYCDRNGTVFDFVNGYEDIKNGVVRFIGDADTRIKEDALRILRFFRFFAWYGSGRPYASGLKASSANKRLITNLSMERVWAETRKMLSAPDPSRALLWMRTTGILGEILPETVNWGIDAIPGLISCAGQYDWEVDYLLRLMAMIKPDAAVVKALATRLTLSNKETNRLSAWAQASAPSADLPPDELGKLLYRHGREGMLDAIRLECVHLKGRELSEDAQAMVRLAEDAANWHRPIFPVKGQDLIDMGMRPGKAVGERLSKLEDSWIESGFKLSKEELLS